MNLQSAWTRDAVGNLFIPSPGTPGEGQGGGLRPSATPSPALPRSTGRGRQEPLPIRSSNPKGLRHFHIVSCVCVAILFFACCALAAPPRVYRDHINPNWLSGNSRFWYRNDLPGGAREFILVDAEKGTRQPAFDHARAATALSKVLGHEVSADKLPIDVLSLPDDHSVVLFGASDAWKLNLADYTLTQDKTDQRPPETNNRPAFGRRRGGGGRAFPREARTSIASPDGKWEAFVRDNNLYLRDRKTHEEQPLSNDGSEKDSYHRDVYRDRAVGMSYTRPEAPATLPEVYWSPDSKHLVAMRTNSVPGRTVYYVQSSPPNALQPALHSYPYLKAGDPIPVHFPHLFDVEKREQIPIAPDLMPNPWDISDIRWLADSSRFTLLFNQRGHQVLRIISVDSNTGNARAIVDEQSKTFIDYSGKMFVDYDDAAHEIIWMSERSGWNHLYLYDSHTGEVKNAITKGDWVVRGVDRVDHEKRIVWFHASGIVPGQDPYFMHYCRVNFDGTGLKVLTEGDGNHSIAFSPDRKFLIDTCSRVDSAPIMTLRSAEDGHLITKLETADCSEVLATYHRLPEPFFAKGRDGQTDIYGIIVRPTNFDPAKKYPIIENIYAGPQDSYVPKSFRLPPADQTLADMGYIVVQIDGMGTSNRSKKFHDVCWKNLGDGGFPDRILWIKAAAEKYPQMDLTRIGIYGTSAGGQNALAGLLNHPDFYTCGVADSGCHDNRMDKIWWNEQWMGYPVGPEYAEQSNVTHVGNLRGPLLLMAGEDDENVDPASTMQVVNGLIKDNKDFDLLIMPGHGHGVLGTPYGRKRMYEFFAQHLLKEQART